MFYQDLAKLNPYSLPRKNIDVYLGDDFIVDLSPMLGSFVKTHPTAVLQINLVKQGVIIPFADEIIQDASNDNDFAVGTVVGVIPNISLDVVNKGVYQLILKVSDSGTQRTFLLPIFARILEI